MLNEFLMYISLIVCAIPCFLVNKIKIKNYSWKILLAILITQSILYFLTFDFKLEAVKYIIMIISSLSYFLISNNKKIELSSTFSGLFWKKLKVFGLVLEMFSAILVIFLRYAELIQSLFFSAKLIVLFFPINESVRELVSNIWLIEFMIILLWTYFHIIFYITRINYKTLTIAIVVLVILGQFELKYWTVITILISLIGLTFSEGFIKSFIKKNMFTDNKIYFIKFLITYSSLLLYISIVFVKEYLTSKNIISFFRYIYKMLGNQLSEKAPIIIEYAFVGMTEILVFLILWLLIKILFKKVGIFNYFFFEEIKIIEKKMKESFTWKL